MPLLSRRSLLEALMSLPGGVAIAALGPHLAWAGGNAREARESFGARVAALEVSCGGRLGVSVFDMETGARFGHRENERFPMCSTFKLLLAGLVLARVDAGEERLARPLGIAPGDLQPHSPITVTHVAEGQMTVEALCAAALTVSDNAAANALLDAVGGPPAVTRFARALGDQVTRLDRRETALNEALPGDPRDTTTPAAMVANLDKLLLGMVLSAASRARLVGWLLACETGHGRLRAGIGPSFRVGDKTGAGDHATANDVAILVATEARRAPVLVAAYLTGGSSSPAARDAVLAEVAAALQRLLGGGG